MFVIDPGDHDDVDLHDHPEFGGEANSLQLSLHEDPRTLHARVLLLLEDDRVVDLRPYLGIAAVHRDGNEPHSKIVESLCGIGEGKSVGGDAQGEIGELGGYQLQRLECLLIGKGISWPGYADDPEFGDLLPHGTDLHDGILGGENLAGDPRT